MIPRSSRGWWRPSHRVRRTTWWKSASGRGALTLPLLDTVEALHVIELDGRMADHVVALAPPSAPVDRASGPTRWRVDFSALARSSGTLRVVGNLPYNVLDTAALPPPGLPDSDQGHAPDAAEGGGDAPSPAAPGGKTYGALDGDAGAVGRCTALLRHRSGGFLAGPEGPLDARPADAPRGAAGFAWRMRQDLPPLVARVFSIAPQDALPGP